MPVLKIDPDLERSQVERVRAWRAGRNADAQKQALLAVEQAAQGDVNMLPLLIDAVKVGATVGELSDVLRGVWGQHRETLTL